MQVAICVTRGVVVDDDIDPLDVDATAEDVGGDKDTLLEVLELRVTGDTTMMSDRVPENAGVVLPFFLVEIRVDGDTGERTFAQELVELNRTSN